MERKLAASVPRCPTPNPRQYIFISTRMKLRCDLVREQVHYSGSSSGSSPELDPVGAADPSLGDATVVGEDLGLFSGMELALDALGTSTQWVVASAVGIALVTRADVGTLVYVVGSLLNAVFSKVLKKTINQVRVCRVGLAWVGLGRCWCCAWLQCAATR